MNNKDLLVVKKILQECCEQCEQGIICIPYFKRLSKGIPHDTKNQIFTLIIEESLANIVVKIQKNEWFIYELENHFPSQPTSVELAKLLIISLLDSISKDHIKIDFKMISKSVPKWLSKNDRDLVLGSIIQFLFYLANYVSIED